jgi:hypothetical protein
MLSRERIEAQLHGQLGKGQFKVRKALVQSPSAVALE